MIDKEKLKLKLLKYRLLDKVTGCWLFTGAKLKGHGYIRAGGRMQYVHRMSAYVYLNYDLDKSSSSYQVNHKRECPNKHCFSPDHLYIGTSKDNSLDTKMIGHHHFASKTHCNYGHLITGIVHIRSNGQNRVRRYCKTCAMLRKQKV